MRFARPTSPAARPSRARPSSGCSSSAYAQGVHGGCTGGARRFSALLALALLAAAPASAQAATLPFDREWRTQGLFSAWTDDWERGGNRLEINAKGAAPTLWRALPRTMWDARAASWRWGIAGRPGAAAVEAPGRGLQLRFVFLPPEEAERLQASSPARLAAAPSARTLAYLWGGPGRPGAIAPGEAPGSARVTLRQGGTGAADEVVDLAADYARAFGDAPGALVAVAVFADAGTGGAPIEAAVGSLVLR